MLIIFSTSYDTTVDLLIHYLKSVDVFRFNSDRWEDYKIEMSPAGFRIEDPTGRAVCSRDVKKAFWRKPAKNKDMFPEVPIPEEKAYCETEVWYVMREMVNILWGENKIVLIEPLADLRAGKFVQLKLACKYFKIPKYQFRLGYKTLFNNDSEVVTKSLTLDPVAGDTHAVIFATKVEDKALSQAYPWMVQEYIHAEADVTVVFVRDQLFAFELDRRPFLDKTVDWRELPVDETSDNWMPHTLPTDIEKGIFDFMGSLLLHFGRLDFLYNKGCYYFLEVNPNGQWAWLDAGGKLGLTSKIVDEISPETDCHCIPECRPPLGSN